MLNSKLLEALGPRLVRPSENIRPVKATLAQASDLQETGGQDNARGNYCAGGASLGHVAPRNGPDIS